MVVLVDEAHRSRRGTWASPIRRGAAARFFLWLYRHAHRPQPGGAGGSPHLWQPGRHRGLSRQILNQREHRGRDDCPPTTRWPPQSSRSTGRSSTGSSPSCSPSSTPAWTPRGRAARRRLSRLLQRADKLLAVLKAPQQIEAIAAHIATHFQAHVLPLGFKAMVVTPDHEACMLYKRALDQYLPTEWSVVVYSADAGGRREDAGALPRRRGGAAGAQGLPRPRQAAGAPIITEKLLTGYDAPVAYAMYLDKPLKEHTLLQAIARINRPYPGVVVDYIGVFDDMQRALSFDQQSYTAGLLNLEQLAARASWSCWMRQRQSWLLWCGTR